MPDIFCSKLHIAVQSSFCLSLEGAVTEPTVCQRCQCAVAKIPTLFSLSPIQDTKCLHQILVANKSYLQKLQGDWEPAWCTKVFGIVWQEDKMATVIGCE